MNIKGEMGKKLLEEMDTGYLVRTLSVLYETLWT